MTSVRIKGPVFDGAPAEVVSAAMEETVAAVAKQGAAIIKSKAAKMNKSGKHTGAAVESVQYRAEAMTAIVEGRSERGRVWWPWLEGTSKRNQSTRFPGYHAFRMAAGVMRKRFKAAAEKAVEEAVAKLGGV